MTEKKKILIVIDMQHDFVDGSLGSPEAQAIVPKIEEKIRSGEYSGILCTLDTHDSNYLQSLEGQKLPVEHCIKGTKGWELSINIDGYYSTVEKETFGLCNLIGAINGVIDEIEIREELCEEIYYYDLEFEICGLCTDICVVSNALILKAYLPNNKIVCDASCCAGTTPEAHKAALTVMKSCQIDVINEE